MDGKGDTVVEVRDLWFSYDKKKWMLKDVNIELKREEKIALVGGNGSGKTTLLLHLNGLLIPDKGEIRVLGNYLRYNKKALIEVRKRVGIIFQNPNDQIVAPIVFQDVALGPINLGLSEEKVKDKMNKALKEINIEHLRDSKTYELSEGEKKKVAIAGVLAMEPEILVLDEPTSELDPESSEDLLNTINNLCEQNDNMTILISTHDVELAYRWADRVLVMKDGEIIKSGKPYEVLSDDEIIKQGKLTMPNILRICKSLGLATYKNPEVPPKNIEELIRVIKDEYTRRI